MALRVLLADESVTIKKVFQLALQDFGVEVTPVTVGVDVVTVAAKIKPDIVFADVLLQKKSGYDVCRELKSQPELTHIPVVLIWSGFMELDENKFKASGAAAHLEKPFDTQRLRQVVQDLVAKTKSQPLGSYLSFPKLPDFEDQPTTKDIPLPPKSVTPPLSATADGGFEPLPPDDEGAWSMDNFAEPLPPVPVIPAADEPEDYVAVKLPSEPAVKKGAQRPSARLTPIDEPVEEDAQWVQKTLSKYKLDPAQQKEEPRKVSYREPQEKIAPQTFVSNAWSRPGDTSAQPPPLRVKTPAQPPPQPKKEQPKVAPQVEDEDVFELESSPAPEAAATPPARPQSLPQLNEKQLEAIIRAQSNEVIEKVVWQVVPEIATRIIERELERLLRERGDK